MAVKLIFTCPVCGTDWHDDPFCGTCGRSLMPTLRDDSVPDWWSELLAATTRSTTNGKGDR